MALAILVFHYDKWLTGTWDASTLQGKLGVYAVSIFFVLSGLTLTLVYETRLDHSIGSWLRFFRKRIFRIFPLLWLATAATLLIDETSRSGRVIILNFAGLFGFVNPAEDIATGAWSIGCELVFYAAFPTLLLLSKKNKVFFLIAAAMLLGFGAWAAFAWFSPAKSNQAEWWEAYVQVANHAFFFVGGMAIGLYRHALEEIPRLFWLSILAVVTACFVCWPIGSEAFHLVSGWNRIVFSGLTLVAVTAFFNSNFVLKGWSHQLLAWLGAVSYSLYLWHPLAFRAIRSVIGKLGFTDVYWQLFLSALLGTLILSHFSYYYLERPLARGWGFMQRRDGAT